MRRPKRKQMKGESSTKIPSRIDWDLWRIVSSERMKSSLIEIENEWTYLDVITAHDVLDLYGE